MNSPSARARVLETTSSSNPTTIGLLVANAADRRLLYDFLHQIGYLVWADAPSKSGLGQWGEVSLILVDEGAARKYGQELVALKQQPGAFFLPLLIALPQNSESAHWLGTGFDDVLRLPMRKVELAARLEVYLELREKSQEQYREIFEHAQIGLYRAAPNGEILIMNPALLTLLGYASLKEFRHDAADMKTDSFFAPTRFLSVVVQACEGNGVEVGLPGRDNATVLVRSKATAVRDGDGAVLYYEGTIEDITEQKLAALALLNSEERFRTVWEIAADAMALSDSEGLVLAANTAYYRLYGYMPEEIIGKEFAVIFPEAIRAQAMEEYKRIFRSNDAHITFETVIQRADGAERTVETDIDFITQAGQRVAMLSSIRDITERKRTDADLRRAKNELEARVAQRTTELRNANAELRRLTQKVVVAQEAERLRLSRELHDEIGQALTAVNFNLQALQDMSGDLNVTSHLQDSVNIIENTLHQVRDISLDLHPSMLDDLGLVAALEWYLQRQSERTGLHIEMRAEPPDLDLSPDLKTTCFRITQEALTNILRHAKAKAVQVVLRQRAEELELLVRDDGVGFDVAAARRRATRGGSVGLLGMQERVVLLNGQIKWKSIRGGGTEIRATFPLTVAKTIKPRAKRRKAKKI